MRKLFTFLFAALFSAGMYAATVVTITEADLPSSGRVLTKDGVTLITGVLVTDPADPEYGNIYQGGTLSTDLGNFVSIEVQASELTIQAMDGWTGDSKNMTWTGSASEVTFIGNVVTFGEGFTITCTIEEAAPTTYTLQLVADPEKGSVAVTNLLGSDIIDNGNGNYTVPENAEVTILATPLEGYEFSGWKVGNIDEMVGCYYCGTAVNTNDNPYSFTMTAEVAYLAEFAAVAPQPAEVTVVFAANSNTVERTVTLPHEFLCSYYNGNGELDAIIQELYGISDGHCCDYIYPVASGNEAVFAGSYGSDNYITISAAFEGTATVSGRYWNWDAYDGDGDWMDYSLTISIKGDETAVDNIQIDKAQSTKLIRNGMLLIEKNGKIYNVIGARVK